MVAFLLVEKAGGRPLVPIEAGSRIHAGSRLEAGGQGRLYR